MLTRVCYLYMLLHVLLSFIARFGSLLASSLQACTDPPRGCWQQLPRGLEREECADHVRFAAP